MAALQKVNARVNLDMVTKDIQASLPTRNASELSMKERSDLFLPTDCAEKRFQSIKKIKEKQVTRR